MMNGSLTESAVLAEGLVKSYGKVKALGGVSLDVRHGETFGIIGPDGAGKSTLFRLLTSLLVPDSGSAQVEGLDTVKDYREIRKIIGYMPGKFSLYQDLTVEENLTFFATLFGTTIDENYHLIEDIYKQIEPFKARMAGKLSGGMKQKLALCCALIHKPKVLFLDEPTTGLHMADVDKLIGVLQRLTETGNSVLVIEHNLDVIKVADYLIDLGPEGGDKGGEIVCEGTPEEVAACEKSYTGQFLKKMLGKR